MMSGNVPTVTRDFTHRFTVKETTLDLTVPIEIPYAGQVEELVGRIYRFHKRFPCFLREELVSLLKDFIKEETREYLVSFTEKKVEAIRNGSVDAAKLAKQWAERYKKGHKAFAPPELPSNEDVFASAYHSLVHSPALMSVLQLEHTMAKKVYKLINQRSREIADLGTRHSFELEKAMSLMEESSEGMSDADITAMTERQQYETDMTGSRWDSQLSEVHQQQRRLFRDWIMGLSEHHHMEGTTPKGSIPLPDEELEGEDEENGVAPERPLSTVPRLEESFTVNLGAQLKQTYNLRLLAADVLDLCSYGDLQSSSPSPHRMQTALSLYSDNLSGLVLLVDNRINSYSGLKKEFAELCQSSTEFHFDPLEKQLEEARERVCEVVKWREGRPAPVLDPDDCSPISPTPKQQRQNKNLELGDFYMTRHSNLKDVCIVYHMVSDDSVLVPSLTSRHPLCLGLRFVLKACCMSDVTTVTLPLLLYHHMTEEMTVAWCTRRAELIFKCVKGYMMEMSSWGGSETKTLQFLVPKDISSELFSNLATLLPSIFKVCNPLVVKSVK